MNYPLLHRISGFTGSVDQWIQKWRRQVNDHVTLADGRDWFCTNSTDLLHNSCEVAEKEERDIEGTEGDDEEVDRCSVIDNLDS